MAAIQTDLWNQGRPVVTFFLTRNSAHFHHANTAQYSDE